MSTGAGPPTGGPIRAEMATIEQVLSRISELVTEQQYYHILEGLCTSDDFSVRVAALGIIVSIEVSVLEATASADELAGWQERFDACSIGLPIPEVEPAQVPGGYWYKISIHGHSEIPPALAMPNDLDSVIAQMIKVQSMICSRGLRSLHFELRRRLRKSGWLKDAWGHEGQADKAARERAAAAAGSKTPASPR